MTLDPESEQNLEGLHPALIACVRRAADILAPQAIYFRVYSGLRTAAQQNADFAKGRNSLGQVVDEKAVVTNARAGQSSHNYGLAVDAVPFSHGSTGLLNWNPADPEFTTFVAAMKTAGLSYGGDWKTFKDNDHWYIGSANPTPEMVALYDGGNGLAAVWGLPGIANT